MTEPKPEAPKEWLMNGNCPECKRLWDEAERVKKERDHLHAENARLREALGKIAASGPRVTENINHLKQWMVAVAEAALAGDGRGNVR